MLDWRSSKTVATGPASKPLFASLSEDVHALEGDFLQERPETMRRSLRLHGACLL
jgi:hypothetical protein